MVEGVKKAIEANPNDKRKHKMKQFFLKAIFKDQNRATV